MHKVCRTAILVPRRLLVVAAYVVRRARRRELKGRGAEGAGSRRLPEPGHRSRWHTRTVQSRDLRPRSPEIALRQFNFTTAPVAADFSAARQATARPKSQRRMRALLGVWVESET